MTKTNNKYASKQTGKVKNKPKQTKPSAAKHKNKAAKHNAETLRTRKQNQHIKQPNNQTNKPAKAHKEAAFCPVFEQCGACQMLNIPYSAQCQHKQHYLQDLFKEELQSETEILPFLGMEDPFFYRNKVASPFALGKKAAPKNAPKPLKAAAKAKARNGNQKPQKEILCGMYAAGTHKLIDTKECLLENKRAKQIIQAIRSLCYRYGIQPYNENTGTGFLRHVIVRIGHTSNEVLVILITNKEEFAGAKNFCKELLKMCPYITSIVQNVNTRQTNVLLGTGREYTLYGPGFILDNLCGVSFRISSRSFYQVNATQTEKLYSQAIKLANLSGEEVVIDAYCGTGTIGLVAACGLPENPKNKARKVIGFDSVASAIEDAKNNARHNGISNAEFIAGDAGECMAKLASDYESIDVVLMDPPRAGSDETFLSSLVQLSPKRVVYISCNPKTQVRDCHYLQQHGYKLETLQAVDMFPHTKHVETIALLTRNMSQDI